MLGGPWVNLRHGRGPRDQVTALATRGTEDEIHDDIVTECEKYPSTILKPATILAEIIKLHDVQFLKITLKNKRPVLNCICAQ